MTNIIDKIFKDNPELKETKEVKDLLDHWEKHYNNLVNQTKRLRNFEMEVLDLCFKSEIMIQNGMPCEEVVESIINEFKNN